MDAGLNVGRVAAVSGAVELALSGLPVGTTPAEVVAGVRAVLARREAGERATRGEVATGEVDALAGSDELLAARESVVVDGDALRVARRFVEDLLVSLRDDRISTFAGNGLVICESHDRGRIGPIRLSTADGLSVGIRAYEAAKVLLARAPRGGSRGGGFGA